MQDKGGEGLSEAEVTFQLRSRTDLREMDLDCSEKKMIRQPASFDYPVPSNLPEFFLLIIVIDQHVADPLRLRIVRGIKASNGISQVSENQSWAMVHNWLRRALTNGKSQPQTRSSATKRQGLEDKNKENTLSTLDDQGQYYMSKIQGQSDDTISID